MAHQALEMQTKEIIGSCTRTALKCQCLEEPIQQIQNNSILFGLIKGKFPLM